ncbi:SGNH/GDSL hydrolase family protein [Nocardiopsis potens]|uniref:SGNH/GDSL hydrolase family protein n=1 Tax=Nocardiopsis potens TaxID=1246458 RepID=UPI0005949B48|nr:SGNH/GDSL hydrolase family protein [Nocardiopsis potens]
MARTSPGTFTRRLMLYSAALALVTAVGVLGPPPREAAAEPAPPGGVARFYDNEGISDDGEPDGADLDGDGRSLSAQALAAAGWGPGDAVVLHGTELRMPDTRPGEPDNAVADGQRVRLRGAVRAVTFLAAATGGDATGTGRIIYRDGSEEYSVTTPDWETGPLATKAVALPYANTPDGPAGEQVRLYAVTVPVDPDRRPTGIELPEIGGGARMHVFDLGVRREQRDWTGTWSASASGYAEVGPWEDQTLRLAVRTGAGGPDTRLHLDNVFAAAPVEIGAVTVALRDEGAAAAQRPVPVEFGGERSAVIPAGGRLTSDPIGLALSDAAELLVSIHLPGRVEAAPVHTAATGTSYAGEPGTDLSGEADGSGFTRTFESWPFLAGIDTAGGTGSVVALGDSITDGVGSTPGADRRWPDVLTDRLLDQDRVPRYGVLNQGISANQVLADRYGGDGVSSDTGGVSALNRLDRDVFAQTGARTVVVFQGINDVRWGAGADELADGLRTIAERSRAHGLRVVAATIAPCGGYPDCTADVDARRTEVNAFIRENSGPGGLFDAVLDFDEVLRDPEDPSRLLPEYDSGDHLHPGDAGLRAIAHSVDLRLLVPEES